MPYKEQSIFKCFVPVHFFKFQFPWQTLMSDPLLIYNGKMKSTRLLSSETIEAVPGVCCCCQEVLQSVKRCSELHGRRLFVSLG